MKAAKFVCISILAALVAMSLPAAVAAEPALIPWPKSIDFGRGDMELSEASRIIAADKELAPLAELLAEEIHLVTGMRPGAGDGRPQRRDILLQIDSAFAPEEYALRVADGSAEVRGGSYRGIAWGTATLLQLISVDGGRVRLPVVEIRDHPDSEYRGVMSDVARNWVSPDDLRKRINLCRLYKIPYMHLHLTDSQAFTFPSKAYPELGKSTRWNWPLNADSRIRNAYTLEELQDLVTYAEKRGIVLIPELDIPGHSGALKRGHEVFRREGISTVDVLSEECYEALDILIEEMAEVFHNSPYIHLGGDEVYWGPISEAEGFEEFLEEHDLRNLEDLFIYFMQRVINTVERLGRQAIVWEGFHGDGVGSRPDLRIPQDTIVMEWSHSFNSPQNLVDNGYSVINASWIPLYTVSLYGYPVSSIYDWNLYEFSGSGSHSTLPSSAPVIGAQLCNWESHGDLGIPLLRRRAAAMSAKTWNVRQDRPYAAFARSLAKTDALLEQLIHPVRIEADGLTEPEYQNHFVGEITVTMKTDFDGEIRYELDGSVPTLESPLYKEPIVLTEADGLGTPGGYYYPKRLAVRAVLFDSAGAQLGGASRADYYPVVPKVRYTLYNMRDDDSYKELPDFGEGELRVDRRGQMHFYNIPAQDKRVFAAEMEGTINVPESAEYYLRVGGSGLARFLLDGKEIISGRLSVNWEATENPVYIEKGPHRFTIQYAGHRGDSQIWLRYVRIIDGKEREYQPNDWLIPLEEWRISGARAVRETRENDSE